MGRLCGLRQTADRRITIKLRGGTAAFQIEMGRWWELAREERACTECGSGEIQDVEHWLLRCEAWKSHGRPLLALMQEHQDKADDDSCHLAYIWRPMDLRI